MAIRALCRGQHGVTLIELMITLAIAILLGLMAFPMYGTWIASQQVRTATEALLDGLRVGQGEAVKRNTPMKFTLDITDGYKVEQDSDSTLIRQYSIKEGSPKTTLTVTPVGTTIVKFDGLGRVLDKDLAPLGGRITIDVTTSTGISGVRAYRVIIDTAAATGVGIRSCDPKLASTDPRGCPT